MGLADAPPAMTGIRTVTVSAAGGPYEVFVGPGALGRLGGLVPVEARRCAIVTQGSIGASVTTGLDEEVVEIPEGEAAKTMAVVEELCRRFSRLSLTRRDLVMAVGGGVVTDVAGFAASVFQRGIRYVNIATTLVAQVDAAIGGKTGVNLPEGKNLVGSFWQPIGVVCDTDLLATLPEEEMRSGMGEVVKCAFLEAPGVPAVSAREMCDAPLSEQIARCVSLKAAIVSADERETSGLRAVLNYGHTLAHALEADALSAPSGNGQAAPIRHGEAVAIGLVFAAHLARRLGRIADIRVEEHRAAVLRCGLGDTLPEGSDPRRLVDFMHGDKKSMFSTTGRGLTFVLDGPRGVEIVEGIDVDLVAATLEEMAS